MRCQGGHRTPAFRVTAGRLASRLPGNGTRLGSTRFRACRSNGSTSRACSEARYRDGESNPGLRVEGPASWPPGPSRRGGSGGTRTHKGSHPYLFSGQAPHLAGSLPRVDGAGLARTGERIGGETSRPHGLAARTPRSRRAPHLAGSLPRVGPSVGFAPTASSVPGTCSVWLSYEGLARTGSTQVGPAARTACRPGVFRCSGLAGTTRTCDPRLRKAVLSFH